MKMLTKFISVFLSVILAIIIVILLCYWALGIYMRTRTSIPLAPPEVISKLPGIILLDDDWEVKNKKVYSAFRPIPLKYEKKFNNDLICNHHENCYRPTQNAMQQFLLSDSDRIPKEDSEQWHESNGLDTQHSRYVIINNEKSSIQLLDTKTKKVITVITEGSELPTSCWSPDNRYLLYTTYYTDGNQMSDEVFLYLLLDTKTNKTYRLFEDTYFGRSCAWIK